MVEIAGEPRSLAEMDFVAAMRPCEACGDWRPVAWRTGGHDRVWIVRAACPRCATERAYAFTCDRDLVEVEPPPLELGGPDPSRLVEPYELVREIDRLVPAIVTAPERLAGDEWAANEAMVDHVRTALAELAKFLAREASSITAHRSAAARADAAARPERYTRAWIAAERAHWDAVAARIAADAPRILAADPRLSRAKRPRGRIDPAALAAHRAWVERDGRAGRRLDIVTADAGELHLARALLAGCRLEGVSAPRIDLEAANLEVAELVEVELDRARLVNASFARARVTACSFTAAAADATIFAGARLTGCTFAGARLAASQWRAAEVEATRFTGAALDRAELGLARLVDCDLRGVSLRDARLAGAVLERCDLRGADLGGCDLRGATLLGCAIAEAHGRPAATAGWVVRDADFSPARDGSDLGDGDDLLEELAAT